MKKTAPKKKMRKTSPIVIPKVSNKPGSHMLSPMPMAEGGPVLGKDERDDRPRLQLYEAQLPELKDMAINDKITLCVEVELQELRKEDYGDLKGQICASFKINKVGVDEEE